MHMYLASCYLRFIQQIDVSGVDNEYFDIIPQGSFIDEEGYFDDELAKKAFAE